MFLSFVWVREKGLREGHIFGDGPFGSCQNVDLNFIMFLGVVDAVLERYYFFSSPPGQGFEIQDP